MGEIKSYMLDPSKADEPRPTYPRMLKISQGRAIGLLDDGSLSVHDKRNLIRGCGMTYNTDEVRSAVAVTICDTHSGEFIIIELTGRSAQTSNISHRV